MCDFRTAGRRQLAPCVLAVPTFDSATDVQSSPYALPVSLEIGDRVLIGGHGGLHGDLSSCCLNGFIATEDLPHLHSNIELTRSCGDRKVHFAGKPMS